MSSLLVAVPRFMCKRWKIVDRWKSIDAETKLLYIETLDRPLTTPLLPNHLVLRHAVRQKAPNCMRRLFFAGILPHGGFEGTFRRHVGWGRMSPLPFRLLIVHHRGLNILLCLCMSPRPCGPNHLRFPMCNRLRHGPSPTTCRSVPRCHVTTKERRATFLRCSCAARTFHHRGLLFTCFEHLTRHN